jgi:hypothetical protein
MGGAKGKCGRCQAAGGAVLAPIALLGGRGWCREKRRGVRSDGEEINLGFRGVRWGRKGMTCRM